MLEIELAGIVSEELNFPEEVIAPIRESIKEQGLHHPLIVVDLGYGKFKLIAGKKRFVALKQLGTVLIPIKIVPNNLTHDQELEISLHENLKRHNLSWYEEVEIEQELHELRQRQKGVKASNRPKAGAEKTWGLRDTANELGVSLGSLSMDLQLAEVIKRNPQIKNIKDKTTAMRVAKNIVARELNWAESLKRDDSFDWDKVYLGDSTEILRSFPAESFDVVLTDPPWSEYIDDALRADNSTLSVIKELPRVMKKNSFLYLVTSTTDFFMYKKELESLGLRVQSYPLIWEKTNRFTHGKQSWEYSRDYEPILLAVKGSPVLTSNIDISSIFKFDAVHPSKMIHPNEKPIELASKILENSSYEGSKILDPFAGSGVNLLAARGLNRKFIGIERDKKYYEGILRRLER